MMQKTMDLALKIEKRYGKLLSLDKVAEYLGTDMVTTEALVKSGELDSLEANGLYMVKPMQLAKFDLDITEMPNTSSPVTKESEVSVMKVTEGSIYSVKSNKNPYEMRFFITFDDGTKRAVKVRGISEKEILQKKKDKVAEVLRDYRNERNGVTVAQKPVDKKAVTFREISEMWLKEFELRNYSKGNSYSNIACGRYSLKAVNKIIGDVDIREIDNVKAQQMINTVSVDDSGKYKSKSHVVKVLRTFKSVMEYALEHGYTDRRIGKIDLNRNLHEADKDSRFIDKETLTALLECVEGNAFYNVLVNLILSSGLRQEEALALTIDDIMINNELYQIYVSKALVEMSSHNYGIVDRLKHGERARYISIPKATYDMLLDYYYESMEDSSLVEKRKEHGTQKLIFVNKNGCLHNKRTLYRSLTEYLKRNMSKDCRIRLHMLRHTFASLMKNEVPLELVSEILGHKDISITLKFYASQTIEDYRRAGIGVEAMMKKIKG